MATRLKRTEFFTFMVSLIFKGLIKRQKGFKSTSKAGQIKPTVQGEGYPIKA
jgi:hypothetical protein